MHTNHHQHNAYQEQVFTSAIDFFKQPIPADIQQRTDQIVAAAELKQADRVLDVGTGTGTLIPHFQRYGVKSITACDLCPIMLQEAEQAFPDAMFWCGDVVDLPASMGPFTVIFFNAMFGNVWDQKETLRFAASRLEATGRLVISHPMGAAFVQELHRSDPKMVPHTLPNRAETTALITGTSLHLKQFQDEPDLYISVLAMQ